MIDIITKLFEIAFRLLTQSVENGETGLNNAKLLTSYITQQMKNIDDRMTAIENRDDRIVHGN